MLKDKPFSHWPLAKKLNIFIRFFSICQTIFFTIFLTLFSGQPFGENNYFLAALAAGRPVYLDKFLVQIRMTMLAGGP